MFQTKKNKLCKQKHQIDKLQPFSLFQFRFFIDKIYEALFHEPHSIFDTIYNQNDIKSLKPISNADKISVSNVNKNIRLSNEKKLSKMGDQKQKNKAKLKMKQK